MLERLDDATSCYSFSFVLEVQNAGVIAAVSRTIRVRVLNPWAWEHTSVNITSLSAREFSRRAWPFQRVKELLVKATTILHASAYNVPLALPWDGHPPFHQGNPVWPRLTDRRNRFFLSTRHIPARNVSVACRIRWRGDLVGFRIGLTTAPSLQCFRACALNFPDPHTFVAANCVVTMGVDWCASACPCLSPATTNTFLVAKQHSITGTHGGCVLGSKHSRTSTLRRGVRSRASRSRLSPGACSWTVATAAVEPSFYARTGYRSPTRAHAD